jgi:SpoVK/Ycf46/Vps4 family AAA+-type ATPase
MILGSVLSYYVSIKLLEHYDKGSSIQIDKDTIQKFPKLQNITLNSYECKLVNYIIHKDDVNVTFDDIGGYDDVKSELRFCLNMMKGNIKTNKLLQIPNGIILHGPPGTGKTMFAKACASQSDCSFINLCPTSFENQFYGESIKLLKGCFELANKLKPVIIFIDEMDGFLSERNDLDQSHNNSLKTLFLALMDGMVEKDASVLVIGATNKLQSIDSAVKRRMMNHINIDLPKINDIKCICERLLENEIIDDDFNYDHLCNYLYDNKLSGSDIKEFFQKCARKCCQTQQRLSHYIKEIVNPVPI